MELENQLDPVDEELVALVARYTTAVEKEQFGEAEEASQSVMACAAARAQADPTPDLLRSLLAHQAEAAGQWDVARQIYETELDEANKEEVLMARPCRRSRTMMHLAALHRWQKDHAAAYEQASSAVQAAREGDFPFHLAMMLEQFAGYALRAGRFNDAIAAATEGLANLDTAATTHHVRCLLLLRRTESHLAAGNLSDARPDLDMAWRAIEPMSVMRSAPGIQLAVARCWQQEAKLKSREANWPAAREAWRNAVKFAREASRLWDDSEWGMKAIIARILAEFAAAAHAAADGRLADSLEAESREWSSQCPAVV